MRRGIFIGSGYRLLIMWSRAMSSSIGRGRRQSRQNGAPHQYQSLRTSSTVNLPLFAGDPAAVAQLVLVHARTRLRPGIPFALENSGRRRQSPARGHSLNEAGGDFSGPLPVSRKQDSRECTSESGPKGWSGLRAQRTPPIGSSVGGSWCGQLDAKRRSGRRSRRKVAEL